MAPRKKADVAAEAPEESSPSPIEADPEGSAQSGEETGASELDDTATEPVGEALADDYPSDAGSVELETIDIGIVTVGPTGNPFHGPTTVDLNPAFFSQA